MFDLSLRSDQTITQPKPKQNQLHTPIINNDVNWNVQLYNL